MRVRQLVAGAVLASFAVFNFAFVVPAKAAAVDNSPDCDQYAVVYCGAFSAKAVENKYKNGDGQHSASNIQSIFTSLGITKAQIEAAGYVDGVVYQNGNVTVNGKVVATNAKTYIRTMGVVSANRMGSAQTAFVKLDKSGKFMFAIMKPCGNPVSAKPVEPPKKPVFDCVSLSARVINVETRKFGYKVDYVAKNGASLQSANFDFGDGKKQNNVAPANINKVTHTFASAGSYTTIVTLKFNTPSGTANDTCKVKINAKPDVCPINPSLPKDDPACKPCPTNPDVPVDSPECKPTEPPAEIPKTGAASMIGTFSIVSFASAAAYRLWMIRRGSFEG